jgi:hypothetical protein
MGIPPTAYGVFIYVNCEEALEFRNVYPYRENGTARVRLHSLLLQKSIKMRSKLVARME